MTYPHPGVDAWESFKDKEVPVKKVEVKWFHASWCAPCRIMKPIIMEMAKESCATFTTIDVDQDSEAVEDAGIIAIPTTHFCCDGRTVHEHVGVMTKGAIEIEIAKARKPKGA